MQKPEHPALAESCLQKLRSYSEESFRGKPDSAADTRFIHEHCPALREAAPATLLCNLKAILCGPYIMDILMEFPDAFCAMLPELEPIITADMKSRFRELNVWKHTAQCVASIRPNALLRLTMLFHDSGKARCFSLDEAGRAHFHGHPQQSAIIARAALERLGCGESECRRIEHLILHHDTRPPVDAANMPAFFALIGEENMALYLEMRVADTLSHDKSFHKRNFEEIARVHLFREKLLPRA